METGRRVVEAVRPHLEEWINRNSGSITFHMAQVLTDHGCFGGYLRRIGKEDTPACHHCEARLDNADHTLVRCPAWNQERQLLVEEIGADLTMPRVIGKMLESEEAWRCMANFCGNVMRKKEEAERARQGQQPLRTDEEARRRGTQTGQRGGRAATLSHATTGASSTTVFNGGG